jgi:archaellum component FlaC
MNNHDDDFVELKTNFVNMEKTLQEIKIELKELINLMNKHTTDVKVSKKDIDTLYEKNRDIDTRVRVLEKTQNKLAAKVGFVTTVLATFITFLINNFLK